MDAYRLRSEVWFDAMLSRGPGGQNVNKTASAAQLYWDFEHSLLLNDWQKNMVRSKLARMVNNDGLLYLRSDESRDLERNKSRCVEKLLEHLAEAFFVPKKRKKTKPTKSSQRKRRESKTRHSETKKNRRRVDDF